MKKIFLFLVLVSLGSVLNCQELYIWVKSQGSSDVCEKVLSRVSELSRKEGLTVNLSAAEKPVEYISFSYDEEMTDEELLAAIEEEKKEREEFEKKMKDSGLVYKSYGKSLSMYELELKRRQEDRELRKNFKYPYFEFNFNDDYISWNRNYKFSIDGTLWTSENNYKNINYEFCLKNKNDPAVIEEYAEKIISVARAQKNTASEEVPYPVDFIKVSDYFDYSMNTDYRLNTILVTGRDDYSYCVTEGKSVRLFDAYGSFSADLHSQFKDEDRKISSWWYGCSADGKSFVYANSGSERAYYFDADGILKKSIRLNLPKSYVFGISSDGIPFVHNMMNENSVSIAGINEDDSKKIEINNRSVERIFITRNKEIYLYTPGTFSVRDFDGKIKNVFLS